MTDNYRTIMYTQFRSTFSNVSVVETADSERILEVLTLYLQRELTPWNYDHYEKMIYDTVKELVEKESEARETTIINRVLAGESNKLTSEKIADILKKLKEHQYIFLNGPETYEVGKELVPTQILHYDVWGGLRVNNVRPNLESTKYPGIELESAKFIEEAQWEQFTTEEIKDENNDEFLEAIQRNQQESERMDLVTALNYIDKELKNKRTVAVLTGIIPDSHGSDKSLRTLAEAVNSWAHDIEILNKKSFATIMTPSRLILPQTTLDNVIFVRPSKSTVQEREIIINLLANLYHITPDIELLSRNLAGLTLHQIQTTLIESFFVTRNFETEFIAKAKKEQVEKHGILTVLNPDYGFERIGGYQLVKNLIKERIIDVLRNPERAEKLNLKPLRGVLLFGLPGTGKSLLAKALAYETNLPLFKLDPGSLYGSLVGQSEEQTRNAIDVIEANEPCIVLFEETDSLGHRTDTDSDSGTSRRVFGTLLDWLGDENRNAIVWGTTNSPQYLDKAFLREGRFTPVPQFLPDYYGRMAIFSVQLYNKWNIKTRFMEGPENPFELFASKTPGATGAEIEGMINEAQVIAFKEERDHVTEADILTAIQFYNIDIDDRLKTQEQYIETAERICRNKQMLEELRREYALIRKTETVG